jgi:hypothetical protein
VTSPLVPVRRAVALGLACGLASRAVLAATIGWLVVLGAVYASDAGPVLPALVVTAAALFPLAAWAGAAHLTSTSEDLRALLTAASGRHRALLADAVPPLLWTAAAAATGTLAAVVFDPHPAPPRDYLLGAALHLLAGVTGAALALTAHALRLTRGGTALLILTATVATLLLPGFPPAGPALHAWADPAHQPGAAAALWATFSPLAATAALAIATAAARARRL